MLPLNELERERKIREVVKLALPGRPEAFQERVIRIILRADINADDPMLLPILSMGCVEVMLHELPATLERREAKLNNLVEALEAQYERFKVAADDVTTVTLNAEKRITKLISLKLPGALTHQDMGKMAGLAALFFILGIWLAQPVTRFTSHAFCQATHTCKSGAK